MSITFDKSRNKYMVRKGRKGFYGRYNTLFEAEIAEKLCFSGISYQGSDYDPKNNLKNGKSNLAANWKGGKPNCLDCGKLVSNYSNKRCQPCRNLFYRGEKSPRWKGGTYGTERHREMGRSAYKDWRNKVFARDDYTCSSCKKTKTYLHADHIVGWAKDESLRYEVSNGMTLCYLCHYKKTFGKIDVEKALLWGVPLKYRGLA